ncbi:hypothetical protein Tco_0789192 [Tanacetum coccineum]
MVTPCSALSLRGSAVAGVTTPSFRVGQRRWSPRGVDIRLGGERDKSLRPADVLLYSWDGGRDVCVDLTGSSPLTQTGMVDFVSGRAMLEAAQRKRVKYEAKCAYIGYGFLPFSFSSFGELEKDAVTLLKRIQKFFVAQDIEARVAIHIFNRISFVIAKGVGAQIVSPISSYVVDISNVLQSLLQTIPSALYLFRSEEGETHSSFPVDPKPRSIP